MAVAACFGLVLSAGNLRADVKLPQLISDGWFCSKAPK